VTSTPHDALFKAAFSKPRHARGLLRSLVPEPLGRLIAWSTLRLESGIAGGDENLDAIGPHVPRFHFLLDDLSVQTDADLRARSQMTAGGRVAILSLKHGRDQVEVRIRVLAPDGRTPAARDVLASVLRYILETSRAEPATLRELLARQVGCEAAEEIMTTAEMLRREGEARGKVQGKREALLLQLRHRFGRLPAATLARIEEAGAAELDLWFRRGLTASSLDEVLEANVAVPPNKAMQPTRAQARGARQRTLG
jgi:hypothetical protein